MGKPSRADTTPGEGGRWIRDPQTGALNRAPADIESAEADAPADPNPETDPPAEADAPSGAKRKKAN